MSKSRKREQAAIEAVARHFSATWEIGKEDWPDAYVTIGQQFYRLTFRAILFQNAFDLSDRFWIRQLRRKLPFMGH
jgi:hypothetical protein